MNKKIKDLIKLLDIKSFEDITSYKVVERFEDDHLDCAIVNVNGTIVEFLWYDDISPIIHPKRFKDEFVDILIHRVCNDIKMEAGNNGLSEEEIINIHPAMKLNI